MKLQRHYIYMLRTTDPTHQHPRWAEFDMITREALNRILGVAVSNVQWGQAQMPVKMEGIGLRAATDHAPAAYVMSLIASHDLQIKILGQTEDVLLAPIKVLCQSKNFSLEILRKLE